MNINVSPLDGVVQLKPMYVETRPLVSLVIPAYNEGNPDRLPASMKAVTAFIEQQDFDIEVIIVNNNSSDNTRIIAEDLAATHDYIRVLNEPEQGKGAAVRTGMLEAQGEYLFFCDADFSMTVEEILKFVPPRLDHFDIAIASRELPASRRIGEPEYRHLMGRVFNWIVKVIAIHSLNDTQCGFKCFRREIAEELFPLQTIDGWAFDIELLFIAQERGYQIVEIPITWYYRPQSKVNPLKDSINMVLETLKIRWNGWRGTYGKKA